MLRARLCTSAAFAATFIAATATAQTPNYHVVKTLDLGATRADYIIVDPAGRRLYGLGDKVVDVDKDVVIGTVEGGAADTRSIMRTTAASSVTELCSPQSRRKVPSSNSIRARTGSRRPVPFPAAVLRRGCRWIPRRDAYSWRATLRWSP